MYAQLKDNSRKDPAVGTTAVTALEDKPSPHPKSRNKKEIHKNSELRESLMGDENGNDQVAGWDENPDLEAGALKSGSSLMRSDDDPFYVFKEDLMIKLESMDDGLTRYIRIIENTDTAVNKNDLKDSKKHLKRHIKNAESTLKDLQATVRQVESKREQFVDIDDAELYDRKTFVFASADRIKQVKAEMNTDKIKAKLLSDERAKAQRRTGLMGAKNEREKENTELIQNSQASAQMMMQQQDETLDELDDAVERVGHMAGAIHEELGQQQKMLNELEEDLEDAEEKLGLVMGKLGKLLKTKNKCQLGLILCLCFVMIILFFLVLYT